MTKPQVTLTDTAVEWAMRQWIKKVVVDLGFCPFAAAVLDKPAALQVDVVEGDARERLQWLLDKLHGLQLDTVTETVLMVMPVGFTDFDDFLDFAELADLVLDKHGFSGEFQLATFHPDYQFAESTAEDAANYTNRSPYPALHILRELSVSAVLENIAEPERIPERNISYARKIGAEALARRLESCFAIR